MLLLAYWTEQPRLNRFQINIINLSPSKKRNTTAAAKVSLPTTLSHFEFRPE